MAGNIKIIEPKDNFQKVSKGIIFNRDIDVLTLGIYVKVLCLGKEWQLNIQGLAQTLNLSEAKIKSSFSLLEREGYVKRVHIKDEATGRFLGFDYHIGFEPFPEDERTDLVATHGRKNPNRPKTQRMENPTDGKPNRWKTQPLEKRGDIYRDNNIDRDNKPVHRDNTFIPPSPQEVGEYAASLGFLSPKGFGYFYVGHYANTNWIKKNGQPVKNWKNNVREVWMPNNRDKDFSQYIPAEKKPTTKNMIKFAGL